MWHQDGEGGEWFCWTGRREIGRQMFEKEQIQIKPWRETCDRAGRGRAGIADKEQEGRKKRTKGRVVGE